LRADVGPFCAPITRCSGGHGRSCRSALRGRFESDRGNQGIGFRIPYTCDGRPGNYYPDLIVKLDDGHGMADLLNLILEVSAFGDRHRRRLHPVLFF
jgi:hypothetical protein